ncbi:Uncharacterized protein RDABS01_022929 [Bienertia sinuspersici]
MGGHGGLNILPQKKWNVYNFDNREKVRKDEEAAAKEEQLSRQQSRKRDSELRLLQLRRARGLDPESSIEAPSSSKEVVDDAPVPESSSVGVELKSNSDSKHINLFDGIKIFDPVKVVEKVREDEGSKKKKMKKEEVRVVGPEDEKYRLGYGVAGKGVKDPWYMKKPAKAENEEGDKGRFDSGGKTKIKSKKTVEELREERLKREKAEKERARALLLQKRGGSSGRYQR